MKEEKIELVGNVSVAKDVENKLHTVGVKGLDFEKAQELGLFQRISNLLCAAHASIMAGYRIYGGVDYLLNDLNCRKNDIAKAMNDYEKAHNKFTKFWTGYYAKGDAQREMNQETESLYRQVMHWAQLPEQWGLGDEQRLNDDTDVAIHVSDGETKYTFGSARIDEEIIGEPKESWAVTKYDPTTNKQTTVESDMDKASALMVAKRLSADDAENIYTASLVRETTSRFVDVTPIKAFKANETVGKITNVFKDK